MTTEWPRLKRRVGKSVTMRHFSSPRMPWAASRWATTRMSGGGDVVVDWERSGLEGVEVDSGAFAGGGGFDEGAESADDASLTADDFADVLFVDFELVDRGVAILDLVDFDRGRLVDERSRDILDQPLQVGLELVDLFFVFQLFFHFFARFDGGGLCLLLAHGVCRTPG